MKRYKVIEVIRLLESDGWIQCYCKGDHRQFKPPKKKEREGDGQRQK